MSIFLQAEPFDISVASHSVRYKINGIYMDTNATYSGYSTLCAAELMGLSCFQKSH